MDLIEFLRARLDEDEATAQAATPGGWRWVPDQMWGDQHPVDGRPERVIVIGKGGYITGDDAEHIARWDPARVLAEVEAKRQALLTRGQGVCTCGEYESPPTDPDTREPIPHHYDCAACEAALMFVQVYADHPDFDPSWRSRAEADR